MQQQFQLLHSLNKYCLSCLLCFSVVVFLCSIYEETKSSYPCGAQETRAAHSHSMRGAVPRARLWLIQENREAALGDGDVIYTTNPGSVIIRILLHFVRTLLSPREAPSLHPRLAHKAHILRECLAGRRACTEAKACSHKAGFDCEQTSIHETNVNVHVENQPALGYDLKVE